MLRAVPAANELDDSDLEPCVPFVPFRCPRCGRHKPRTHYVRGRLRKHICQACGLHYRSVEVERTELKSWRPPPAQ